MSLLVDVLTVARVSWDFKVFGYLGISGIFECQTSGSRTGLGSGVEAQAPLKIDGTSTPPSIVVGSALGPLRSDPQVITIPRVAPGRYALAVWCAKCVPQTLYVMKPAASGSASGVIEIASVGQGAAADSSMFTIVLTGVIVAGTAACVVAVWRARKPRQRSTSLG